MSEASIEALRSTEAHVTEYVAEYELSSDAGDYTPTERERVLIIDAIEGLLSDPEFVGLFFKWRVAVEAH